MDKSDPPVMNSEISIPICDLLVGLAPALARLAIRYLKHRRWRLKRPRVESGIRQSRFICPLTARLACKQYLMEAGIPPAM